MSKQSCAALLTPASMGEGQDVAITGPSHLTQPMLRCIAQRSLLATGKVQQCQQMRRKPPALSTPYILSVVCNAW